jgi:folylpolyglutamate synthase/dihydropteroate synthase
VQSARAARPEDLERTLGGLGLESDSHPSLDEAIKCAEKEARPRSGTLICGSIYLAGQAMELLGLGSAPVDFGQRPTDGSCHK